MSDLRDTLYAALRAEPKPVTEARMLAVAQATLPPLENEQFKTWAKVNGLTLLGMLNG